jgi:hypothetical protein
MARECGNTFVAIDELSITQNLDTEKSYYKYENAYLSIETTGFEQTYQWYVTNDSVASGVPINGATSNILKLDTSEASSRKYYVVVTDWDRQTITSNICSVNVDGNVLVRTIISSSGDNGTISPLGESNVLDNDSKTFEFLPDEGYHVSKIVVDGIPLTETQLLDAVANGYTFDNVTSNHTIHVEFAINTYTITLIQAQHGVITCDEVSFTYGSQATIHITPDAGYSIGHLIVDGSRYTDSTDMTTYLFRNISSNHKISALFTPNRDTQYVVKHWQESIDSTNATLIGDKYYILESIEEKTGTTDSNTYAINKDDTGYVCMGVAQKKINGDGSTVVNIFYNRMVYTLAVLVEEGVVRVNGSGDYRYGDIVTISAVVKDGYQWKYWTSKPQKYITNITEISYTFSMPNENLTIYPNTEKIKHVIVLSVNGQGSASSNIEYVAYDEEVVVTMTPEEGWKVHKVYVDGVEVEVKDNKITLQSVTKDIEIEAVFVEDNTTILGLSVPTFIMVAVIFVLILAFVLLFMRIEKKQRERF